MLSFLASLAGIAMPISQKFFIRGLNLSSIDLVSLFALLGCAAISVILSNGLNESAKYYALDLGKDCFFRYAYRLRKSVQLCDRDTYNRQASGTLFNHLSQDIVAISTFVEEAFPMLISAFWPMLVAPMALSYLVGLPTLHLIIVLIPGLILAFLIALVHAKLFSKLKKRNDDRVSGVAEFVRHIDVLRMTSWLDSGLRRIGAARKRESQDRFIMAINGTLMNVVCYAIPAFVNAYALYLLIHYSERVFDAEDLVASYWVCSVFLAGPFRKFPIAMVMLFDAYTSRQRLLKTFNALRGIRNERPDHKKILIGRGLTLFHGSSGSGKTRMLNILNDSLNSVACYCSERGFFFRGSIDENVTLRGHNSDVDKQRVKSILGYLGLNELTVKGFRVEANGKNLSGGMKQRLSLARAAFFDREFIFLDNSLSALDAPNYKRIFEQFILGYWKDKKIVLVSNDEALRPFAIKAVNFDEFDRADVDGLI